MSYPDYPLIEVPFHHPNKSYENNLKLSITKATLSLLGLYQLEYIEPNSLKEKQKIINTAINEINTLLPVLFKNDRHFIKGVAEYYMGNWESALISLQ
jgi:hypothetical protein